MRGLIGVAGGIAVAAGAYAAACPWSQWWGRGFHRGPSNRRLLALTFDDGPSNETPAFLDLLARYQVRASFFVCGTNVARRPAIAREALAAGHEIANHTHTHPLLPSLPPWRVRAEVERAQRLIEDCVGVQPSMFRAPFGIHAPGLRGALEQEGLMAVRWTVMGHDWRLPAERVSRRLLRGAGPGGILCLHDGDQVRPVADRSQTLQALDAVLPPLLEAGYRFVTVSEMCVARDKAV